MRISDRSSDVCSSDLELVQNYLQLRVIDEQKRLLQTTVDNYQRSLKMTENQYRAGVSGRDAVAQAQTQLKTTQAELIDLIWQQAQFENAIAVRSEERRVGKERVSTGRTRWLPKHEKQKKKQELRQLHNQTT